MVNKLSNVVYDWRDMPEHFLFEEGGEIDEASYVYMKYDASGNSGNRVVKKVIFFLTISLYAFVLVIIFALYFFSHIPR